MPKIALVTGANQGLGLALVKLLSEKMEQEDIIYLASRSEENGRKAMDEITNAHAQVRLIRLDVTNSDSIVGLHDHLKNEHDGIDIVASNAAARISKDTPQSEQVRNFVNTNNHGSRELLGVLIPLLNDNARYVIVASSFGQLSNLPIQLRPMFDTDKLSLDDIDASMDSYVNAMEANRAAEQGWPEWINTPSKVGQVATARIAAREVAKNRPTDGILINAVCPGLMDTAASRPWFDDMSDALSPEQAALPIIDILLSPPESTFPSGELLQYGRIIPWLSEN